MGNSLGGQSINAFDYAMAEGVKKSFKKAVINKIWEAFRSYIVSSNEANKNKEAFIKVIKEAIGNDVYFDNLNSEKFNEEFCIKEELQKANERKDLTCASINKAISACISLAYDEYILLEERVYIKDDVIYDLAVENVIEETHQAMESVIHNFNTLHSRAGAQVPFSSLNYGMDTSPEGQLVIDELLNAIYAGLGHGETPIFPISVFQLKSGVNYNHEDPNYYLFKKSCKVSAKRLFPNYISLDSSFNKPYYKKGDYNSYVATMGCRSRVMSNVNGKEESGSRGNFAFVTINLPMLALEANGDLKKFYKLFDKYIQISHDYILERFKVIAKKHVYNFPFLMGQGVWMGSENLKPNDSIKDVLKHASYSIGFCGLAECLVALIGKHHGESEEAQKLGLEIVGHLRAKTDEYTEKEHWNWTCFATPAESTAGQFQRANQKRFGIIPGVTDRDYMTNSNHVPVYYDIKAIDKIRIEAPYHALCNAGHIAYIECQGDLTKNVEAFERLVRAMHDADMGYFSINHPVDRDPVCGFTGIINNECPCCHRRDNEFKTGKITIPRIKMEETK